MYHSTDIEKGGMVQTIKPIETLRHELLQYLQKKSGEVSRTIDACSPITAENEQDISVLIEYDEMLQMAMKAVLISAGIKVSEHLQSIYEVSTERAENSVTPNTVSIYRTL